MPVLPRRLLPLALALAALAVLPAATSARKHHLPTLRLGRLRLHPCPSGRPGWCGSILRALDPGLRGGPSIPIGFEWLPAPNGPAQGTVVAVEGGPGFPSTGSIVEYTGTFGPLLGRRNLLLVDNRGTGTSALIYCSSLDGFPVDGRASGARFDRLVGACGSALDHSYRMRGGAFVHAADLFGTAYAVDDLRAVLQRAGVRRIDLYGDSYGSWFVQAFIARFPGVLRSVILDSTYPVRHLSPSYGSSGSSGRAALDRVCARDPGCAAATVGQGTPVDRLATLLRRLRRRPLRGVVPALSGHGTAITVRPRQLVDLFQNAGFDPIPLRELDASVRAALSGDPAPLLRLVAESASVNGGSSNPGFFSDGDYMAVACTDYPQLFSLSASPAARRRQLGRSIAATRRGVFAPFAPREWYSMTGYSEPYDSCLDWPAPVHRQPVLPANAPQLPASVPLLIVGGDLDDLTPLSDAERFGPRLGRLVRVVDLVNTVHVTSEGDTYLSDGAACARAIIRRFVLDPAAVSSMDTRCAARIPHIHTPGAYPVRFAGLTPAGVVSRNAVSLAARQAARLAADAFGDAVIQRIATGSVRGRGLRGGEYLVRGERVTLTGYRFVADARVDGIGTYDAASGAVRARLIVTAAGRRYRMRVRWRQSSRYARAQIGRTILQVPAP